MIIYLIGFAGTGKLTVAKEIIKHNKEFTLIDNHKINDLIFNGLINKEIIPLLIKYSKIFV